MTQAEFLTQALKKQGFTDDEVAKVLRERGMTDDVITTQKLIERPPVKSLAGEELQRWQAGQLAKQKGYGTPEQWYDAISNGAQQVEGIEPSLKEFVSNNPVGLIADFQPQYETFKDRMMASLARTTADVKQLGEATLGLLSLSFRPQQALFRSLKSIAETTAANEPGALGVKMPSWDRAFAEVKVAMLPELYDESVAGDESTMFQEGLSQINNFFSGKFNFVGGAAARDAAIANFRSDTKIMEKFQDNVMFRQVIDAIAGAENIDAMLEAMDKNGIPNWIDVGAWTLLDMGGEITLDPLFVFDKAPQAVAKMEKAVLGVERTASKALRSAPRTIDNAVAAVNAADEFVRQAQKALAKKPGDKELVKALYRAEQFQARAQDVLNSMKGAGAPAADIVMTKPRRKPVEIVEAEVKRSTQLELFPGETVEEALERQIRVDRKRLATIEGARARAQAVVGEIDPEDADILDEFAAMEIGLRAEALSNRVIERGSAKRAAILAGLDDKIDSEKLVNAIAASERRLMDLDNTFMRSASAMRNAGKGLTFEADAYRKQMDDILVKMSEEQAKLDELLRSAPKLPSDEIARRLELIHMDEREALMKIGDEVEDEVRRLYGSGPTEPTLRFKAGDDPDAFARRQATEGRLLSRAKVERDEAARKANRSRRRVVQRATPAELDRLTREADDMTAIIAHEEQAMDRLRARVRDQANWPGFGDDDYLEWSRRAHLGATDGEVVSDTLTDLAHGASIDDVTMQGTFFPEYHIERLGDPHPASGRFPRRVSATTMTPDEIAERVDIDKFLPGYEDRTKWFDGEGYTRFHRLFRDLMDRGMAEGSFVPRMSRTLDRFIFWPREPMRALQRDAPGIFERMRTGQAKYDHEVAAQLHWMEGAFERAGLGKMSNSGFKVKDQKRAELLFDILDTDPLEKPQQLAKLLSEADAPMRQVAAELRSHMNWLAHRQGLSGDQFISGYIHHVFDKSWLKKGGWRPLELMGLGRNTEIMAQHLLERKGHLGYKKNPVEAMELMVRGATRKLVIQPMLEDMVAMGAKVGGRTDLYTRMLTDVLKGKPGHGRTLANLVTHGLADKVDQKLASISGAFYVGILTGNAKYILENWATAVTTTTARYGMGRTLKGMLKMATPEGRRIAKAANVDKLWDTMLETPQAKALLKGLQDAPLIGLHRMEFDIRGMTFWAALEETMNNLGFKTFKELEESGFANRAMFDAVRRTEAINHFYGAAGRSPIFNQISPGPGASQTAMQFLSFGPKQIEELSAQFVENPGYIMRYLAMSGILTRIAAQELGIDTSENIGLGFVGPSVEAVKRGGGPGVQAIKSFALLMQAADEGDWTAMQQHSKKFLDTVERAVPLATMVHNGITMASELHNQAKINPATGEKIRDLNLDLTDPFNERIPTVLQVPSVQDRLQRQFDEAARRNTARPLFEMREALKEYKRALAGDDGDHLSQAIERLAELGIPFDPSMSVAKRDMLLRNVDRSIRTLLEDPAIHGENFDLILDNPFMY